MYNARALTSASTDLLTADALFSSWSLEPLPWWWWWPPWWSDDACLTHFSASSHLEGTDLLAETSWWCAGLEELKNSNGRPGVAGTCCCWCWCCSARLLWAEAEEEEDEEAVEVSRWYPWPPLPVAPLLLLLLAMVAMGKDDLTNSDVSLRLRLQSGSLNVGPNGFMPPPPASAPTPWNEFCKSMDQTMKFSIKKLICCWFVWSSWIKKSSRRRDWRCVCCLLFLLMAMLQMAADSVRKKKTWAPWRRLSWSWAYVFWLLGELMWSSMNWGLSLSGHELWSAEVKILCAPPYVYGSKPMIRRGPWSESYLMTVITALCYTKYIQQVGPSLGSF